MKKLKPLIILLTLFIAFPIFAQDNPQIGFIELMEFSEEDFNMVLEARELTALQNIPHTIYLKEDVFIEAKMVDENNQVLYSVVHNLAHPSDGGEVVYWSEIESRFDLSDARIHWVNKPTKNPTLGILEPGQEIQILSRFSPSFLMIPESTNDGVMIFNATTGDLINIAYISDPANLSTPIEALLTPNATILLSDQLNDHIVEYDTFGVFSRILFGGNTAVLDNCRGIEIRPGANSVVGTIGSGVNDDGCPEFDLTTGNYLGNFIANGAGGLDSPFDIIFRTSDCLVGGITSDAIHQYDLSGNSTGIFSSIDTFPEQLAEVLGGNIAVGNFSGTQVGIVLYDASGTLLNVFTGVSGNRGVYQLPGGNFLTTNGTGVYEIDGTTGTLVRTIVAGVSARFIREYDLAIVPVELTSFLVNLTKDGVLLNWKTATELNNSGFQIERSQDNESYEQIAFVPGFGSTTEPKSYRYNDNSVISGTYYYRLKQIDYDGSFTYSGVVEVNIGLPTEFALEQNHPNPFNPSTVIEFSLPEDVAKVSLTIYDILGQKVTQLVNTSLKAGKYQYQWNAGTVATGMYIYELRTDNFVSVKKMMLLK